MPNNKLPEPAANMDVYDGSSNGDDGSNDFVVHRPEPVAEPQSTPKATALAASVSSEAAGEAPEPTFQDEMAARFGELSTTVTRIPGTNDVRPAQPKESRSRLMAIILKTKSVKDALRVAREEQAKFRATRESVRHLTDPKAHAKQLVSKIDHSTDAAEIEQLRAEHARYIGEAAQVAIRSGHRIIDAAFAPLEKAVLVLLDAADARAIELAKEIENAERALFAKYDLAREATTITAKLNVIRGRIAQRKDILTSFRTRGIHSIRPGSNDDTISMFEE